MTLNSQQRFAPMVDGCKLAYSHYLNGNKSTLVLSNSLGTTQQLWRGQIAAFAEHFNLITYDKRGHGQSDITPGDYSLDRLGNDVIELLDILGLDKVHFCGISIGGMTGQWLATFHPSRIDRLVIANSAPIIPTPSIWQERINQVQEHGLESIWSAVVSRWVSDNFAERSPADVEFMRSMFLQNDAQGYAACCAAIRDMDLRNVAQLNYLKTLIIGGTQDLATPIEQSEYLLDQYHDAKLLALDAGHLSNIEQADLFTSAVLDFLHK
ncbi:3-oxoadipate enol-lactonase [Arenicella sp.]|nr:3-oxoadipate enol-lactonase [Arenicella sp.]